jgi:hypothetical protein
MRTKVFWSIIGAGFIALSIPANAQSTSSTRCGYVNGIRTCSTTSDSATSTNRTTCQYYGGGASDCTTDSQDKAPSQPSVQTIKVDLGAEKTKAEARAKAGYRDPNARALGCPAPYRMTERDGCQLSRR